jgi:hypothetical protein
VIDEEVDIRTIVLDVPLEYRRIGSLEHDFLHADRANDLRRGIGAPFFDIFGNALGLDHDDLSAGIKRSQICNCQMLISTARTLASRSESGGLFRTHR